MITKSSLFLFFLTASFCCSYVFANPLEALSWTRIAVEKNTGRADNYETGFSGWVGSLRFFDSEDLITISEFSMLWNKASVVNSVYKITRKEEYRANVNFECVDIDTGFEWIGKLWLTDNNEIKIEVVQKKSARKWTNLGKNGRKFLKDNKLNLNLGIGM